MKQNLTELKGEMDIKIIAEEKKIIIIAEDFNYHTQ